MAKRNLEVGAPLPSCVCACIHTQLCPTLCNPMNCGPPGSSVHGIFQARILEWVVISYSGESPDSRIKPLSLVSPALAGGFFTTDATSNHLEVAISWSIAALYPQLGYEPLSGDGCSCCLRVPRVSMSGSR